MINFYRKICILNYSNPHQHTCSRRIINFNTKIRNVCRIANVNKLSLIVKLQSCNPLNLVQRIIFDTLSSILWYNESKSLIVSEFHDSNSFIYHHIIFHYILSVHICRRCLCLKLLAKTSDTSVLIPTYLSSFYQGCDSQ